MVAMYAMNGACLGSAYTPQELRLALMIAHKLGVPAFSLHGVVKDRKYSYSFSGEISFEDAITRLQEA